MPFPFTFNFIVPGLSNPFTPPPLPPAPPDELNLGPSIHHSTRHSQMSVFDTAVSPSSSSYTTPPQRSRKRSRHWEPTPPMTTTREMVDEGEGVVYVDQERDDEDDPLNPHSASYQPPAKRRRLLGGLGGLGGLALTAAAVDGVIAVHPIHYTNAPHAQAQTQTTTKQDPQQHQQHEAPPPPYTESAASSSQHSLVHEHDSKRAHTTNTRLRTPQRQRQALTPRRRRVQPRSHIFPNSPAQPEFSFNAPSTSASGAAFTFAHAHPSTSQQPVPQTPRHEAEEEGEGEGDDSLSRLTSQLTSLIAEGKRALGREVVVMSECREDEEDDGLGGWVDEDAGSQSQSQRKLKRRGSGSRRGRGSPYLNGSANSSLPGTPLPNATFTVPSTPAAAGLGLEREEWESPEIRESMERARRKVLEARAARGL
ncbi:hypothetical protein VNI00_000458 [Paramarasmius palmivorus]|uniref:Uncharacterized protein n=1 Tax=Paramarasmius palmivorus TaxID=297713 RepID=A0AAW0E5K1_9AGAR